MCVYIPTTLCMHLECIHHPITPTPSQHPPHHNTHLITTPTPRPHHPRTQVTVYFAPQFHALRSLLVDGGDQLFAASISRCRRWDSQGGKSNAYFAKSRDNRWVIKQLSKTERQSFLELAPNYLKFLATSVRKGRDTCLGKIVGAFQVMIKPSGSQSNVSPGQPYTKEGVIDFIIMENMFYGRVVQRIYDLKGSERSRYNAADDPNEAGTVLLDENLKETNAQSPLLVGGGVVLFYGKGCFLKRVFLEGGVFGRGCFWKGVFLGCVFLSTLS